ncbi:MAG TPA: DUF3015 family protein [Bdellovibrionales bacterium]|nr:DUF3015 family protein [Bdellovibrionales bacterium]
MKHLVLALAIAAFIAPSAGSAQTKKKKKSATAQPAVTAPVAAEPAPAEPTHRKSLHDEFSGQGYGVAGCGLGSIIFGPKQGMIQIIAATSNGLGGNQTFGITSGTSNCDIPSSAHQAAVFIEVNREVLAKEAARGQGETVAGLAYILGCSDASMFGKGLQDNFQTVFSSENDSMTATRNILSTIETNEALKASCNING